MERAFRRIPRRFERGRDCCEPGCDDRIQLGRGSIRSTARLGSRIGSAPSLRSSQLWPRLLRSQHGLPPGRYQLSFPPSVIRCSSGSSTPATPRGQYQGATYLNVKVGWKANQVRKFVFLYETSRLVASCSMQRRCRHWDSTRRRCRNAATCWGAARGAGGGEREQARSGGLIESLTGSAAKRAYLAVVWTCICPSSLPRRARPKLTPNRSQVHGLLLAGTETLLAKATASAHAREPGSRRDTDGTLANFLNVSCWYYWRSLGNGTSSGAALANSLTKKAPYKGLWTRFAANGDVKRCLCA